MESMSFFRGDVYSYALDKMTPLNIYLPYDDNKRFLVTAPQRTVILLHGLEGNYSYWNRYTCAERYAQSRNIALVMPDAEMSNYTNMRYGHRYAEYIAEELPEMLDKMFRLNLDREHFSIGGLSMGGYGAVKIALTYPEIFGRCASFSGALHMGSREYMDTLRLWKDPGRSASYDEMTEIERSMFNSGMAVYGEDFKFNPENDLLYLAEQLIISGRKQPDFLFTCGTEDFLYDVNKKYIAGFSERGLKNRFFTWHGIHNWQFWEESIRDHIDFFCGDK